MPCVPEFIEEIPVDLPFRRAFVVFRDQDGIAIHWNTWDVAEYQGFYVFTSQSLSPPLWPVLVLALTLPG